MFCNKYNQTGQTDKDCRLFNLLQVPQLQSFHDGRHIKPQIDPIGQRLHFQNRFRDDFSLNSIELGVAILSGFQLQQSFLLMRGHMQLDKTHTSGISQDTETDYENPKKEFGNLLFAYHDNQLFQRKVKEEIEFIGMEIIRIQEQFA
ncbi:MAG: hypothetical protein EZS28_053766 [Streblomastix strix]|uniref:Uncharacterized protein n=1 Tax=Streblomastix strix TaxID=222440 RepID=A0A5J4R366_9EUKA|nr:MAG: hypothetical protein EZS28_053766 [Streblomastix strix]